jgi:hypothetical protein
MKPVRIILGLLLIWVFGGEYAIASRQLFTFFLPAILSVVLTVLLLSAWLIGSGFSKESFKIKSLEYLKFYVVSFLLFGLVVTFRSSLYKPSPVTVEFNHIKIPIGEFMDGSRRIVPDLEQRKTYCSCVVEKLANSEEVSKKYRAELESGEIDKIFAAIKTEEFFFNLNMESCFNSVQVQWTDNLANSMKATLKTQLSGTEFERTNNLDVYCNCLIEEYKKYPFSEIGKDDFKNSQGVTIDSICIERSKKNTP